MAINFFQEDIQYDLKNKIKIKRWLKNLAESEAHHIKELNYIFCTDEYLYSINVEYLQHNTYTDIITFDNSEDKNVLEGDVFISIDRVRENANTHKQLFQEELLRVLSHGLFHLCGIGDKSDNDIVIMRSKEDAAIYLYNTSF